jgi:putative ABC transport system permease protein
MDAHLGRGFSRDEIETSAPVVMLTRDVWTNCFGADSTMVGNTIGVNGNPYTLIGIIPAGVDIYGTDLWMTLPAQPSAYSRNRRQFQVMARVREGISLREVNTELEGLARRVEQSHAAEFEEYEGWSMQAMTWNNVSSQFFQTGAWVLLGAVSFVLLLVCANTANLLLARARARQREMAVRTALGAGRIRLVGQLLTESVTLALVGGLLGVAFAYAGVRGVLAFVNTLGLPVAGSVEINAPVLVFTAAIAVAAGVIFGLAPAVQASRVSIATALQSDGKGTTSTASRQRLQRTLVGLEVALAFVLLAGGGLLVNSFVRMNRVDPGFDAENVLTMRLTLSRERFQGQEVPAFFQELTERLEALPGVREAGAGTQFPPVAFAFRQVFFDGEGADAEATLPTTLTTSVTSGYFEALGIPIQRGRTFDDRDQEGTSLVAVINEEAARRFFPGQDAIGKRLKIGEADAEVPWWEVVGVVGSTKNLGLDQDPFPEIFAVHQQVGGNQNQLFLLLRTDADPRSLVAAVRSVVLEMAPDQPVYGIRTIEETYRQGVAPMRATTLMLSLFAGFALILAAVGIYSVVSFTVGQRTQEIGLRMALGADRGQVHRLVVRQALVPVAIGAVVGAGGAVAVSRGLEQILFEITGTDPFTLVSVGVTLVLVAVVASWVPAFRAARLDPVEALRAE